MGLAKIRISNGIASEVFQTGHVNQAGVCLDGVPRGAQIVSVGMVDVPTSWGGHAHDLVLYFSHPDFPETEDPIELAPPTFHSLGSPLPTPMMEDYRYAKPEVLEMLRKKPEPEKKEEKKG